MNSKLLFLIVILLIIRSSLTGQSKDSFFRNTIDETIYSTIIDTLATIHKFEFYLEKLNYIETNELALNPSDSITLFDPETYEERTIQGLEYKIESDSMNYAESILFRTRIKYPDGLYLIGKISDEEVHKNINLKEHLTLENYPEITKISEFNEHILMNNKLGHFTVFPSTKENIHKFKYAVKANISFSGIKWNSSNDYAIVECGFHYRYGSLGHSGGGFQAILKSNNGQISIVKTIGLWEE